MLLKFLLVLLRGYQCFFSAWFPAACRFEPSCSCYAQQALKTHGVFLGLFYTIGRLFRCQPFCKGGIDPVPLLSGKGKFIRG